MPDWVPVAIQLRRTMVWRSLGADGFGLSATHQRYDRGVSDVATRADGDQYVLLERRRDLPDDNRTPYFRPDLRTAWKARGDD